MGCPEQKLAHAFVIPSEGPCPTPCTPLSTSFPGRLSPSVSPVYLFLTVFPFNFPLIIHRVSISVTAELYASHHYLNVNANAVFFLSLSSLSFSLALSFRLRLSQHQREPHLLIPVLCVPQIRILFIFVGIFEALLSCLAHVVSGGDGDESWTKLSIECGRVYLMKRCLVPVPSDGIPWNVMSASGMAQLHCISANWGGSASSFSGERFTRRSVEWQGRIWNWHNRQWFCLFRSLVNNATSMIYHAPCGEHSSSRV